MSSFTGPTDVRSQLEGGAIRRERRRVGGKTGVLQSLSGGDRREGGRCACRECLCVHVSPWVWGTEMWFYFLLGRVWPLSPLPPRHTAVATGVAQV